MYNSYNMIDLSNAYESDHPPTKRGRKFIYFPSGLNRKQVADRLGIGAQTVAKWCHGLRITASKKDCFLEFAGFASEAEFRDWIQQPIQPGKQVIASASKAHDKFQTEALTNHYPKGWGSI